MSYRTDDPFADFDRWDRDQQKELDSLPWCEHCNEPIQDEDLMDIDGTLYHLECAEREFKRKTEDYIE